MFLVFLPELLKFVLNCERDDKMTVELKHLKVALVHDWLTGMRGGEKVLEVLCELFPESDLYTLLHNPGSVSEKIEAHRIFTSFVNRLPFKATRYRHYLPLFPTAIELFNFKSYDLVVSTSHCVAKGIIPPPGTLHISYLHTPMRYVWDMYDEYFAPDKLGWFSRKLIPLFANYLRLWDVSSSNRVDWFLANSRHVANRIRKYYRREATVIHPPVDTDRFAPGESSGDYYLIVSALVPYKKVDLAVRAFRKMKKRLIVVGQGPESDRLKALAGPETEFVDWQPPERLREYYAGCRALIFPGEEDFGIVPVEAMASGKPVIAYARGGALETIIGYDSKQGKKATGVFFPEQTEDSLIRAVEMGEQVNWDARFIAQHAQQFSREIFRQKIEAFIRAKVQDYLNAGNLTTSQTTHEQ